VRRHDVTEPPLYSHATRVLLLRNGSWFQARILAVLIAAEPCTVPFTSFTETLHLLWLNAAVYSFRGPSGGFTRSRAGA